MNANIRFSLGVTGLWLCILSCTLQAGSIHLEPGASPDPIFSSWKVAELLPDGRFDAVAYLGNNTIIIGSRGKHPGKVFRSTDGGHSWTGPVEVTEDQITCLASGKNGLTYLLTAQADVYKSSDYGKSWHYLGQISDEEPETGYARSYGLHVTDHGTLLVTDTGKGGGSIYRSVDRGETWERVAQPSQRGLYRFERTGNGIIVNGWGGNIYQTQDDGLTWEKLANLTEHPLYATEYIGRHVTLQASEDGRVFRSGNYGQTWTELDIQVEAADDFVKLGHGAVLLSTYRDAKNMYISVDNALSWKNIGPVNTGADEDWLDHAIYIDEINEVVMIGVTNKGFVIRATIQRADLMALGTYQHTIADQDGNQFQDRLLGLIVDFDEINEPEDVLLHQGFAYLPNRDGNSIAVMDIKNPEKPVLAASIRNPLMLDMFGIHSEGDFLYAVSMSNQTLIVHNIADPYNPVYVSHIQLGGVGDFGPSEGAHIRAAHSHTRLRKVYVKDGYAYVTHNNEGRLYIVDVRNPASMSVAGFADTGDGAFAVIVHDNVAYVAGCFPGYSVVAIDVGNKTQPRVIKKIQDDQNMRCTCNFQIAGNYLYATGWSDSTLLIFDISDPANFTLETVYRHEYIHGPGRLVVRDNKAYIINTINSSMTAIDITNPQKPELDFFVSDPLMLTVYGVGVDDRHIYLAARDARSFIVLSK